MKIGSTPPSLPRPPEVAVPEGAGRPSFGIHLVRDGCETRSRPSHEAQMRALFEDGTLPDFESLAPAAYRAKFGLGPLAQVGIAVRDVKAAAEQLERLGVGPFLLSKGTAEPWTTAAGEGSFVTKVGFFRVQGVEIELVELDSGAAHYEGYLAEGQDYRLHHVGFYDHDKDQKRASIEAASAPHVGDGVVSVGPLKWRFTYYDTRADNGLYLELMDQRLGKRGIGFPDWLINGVARLSALFR